MADDIVTRLRATASACWCAEKSQGEPVGKPFFRCETCDDQLRAADLIEAQQTEMARLRQAIWDACAILGMDTDGNATPRHLIHPSLDELIDSEARRARQDYDDLLEELEIQHD